MRLCLLDRDGVIVVNRKDNIKTPGQLALLDGAAPAIARLNRAGVAVAICTNQPEVGRGAMTLAQLDAVHRAMTDRLAAAGARVDRIFTCTSVTKCPDRKPAPGMLRRAAAAFGARAGDTPFIGDQRDDLEAAFHAGCPRVLVKTGLGRKTLAAGVPDWLGPVQVCVDLAAAVQLLLAVKEFASGDCNYRERDRLRGVDCLSRQEPHGLRRAAPANRFHFERAFS